MIQNEAQVPTNHGMLTAGEIINDLIYISYRYNRQRSPEVPVEHWAHPMVFGKSAYEMERIFQAEVANERK